jgi:hypothetical protein
MKSFLSYLRRLPNHPGFGYATYFSLIGALAGLARGGGTSDVLVGLLMGSIFWPPVLLTNLDQPG